MKRFLLRAEAVACLLGARLALAVCPFRRLTWLFNRPTRRREPTGPVRERVRREVRAAIRFGRRHSLLPTTCLHRAIAAQAMLRRRGVRATLYYGAATLPECGLRAHAWVKDGSSGVTGWRTARRDGYKVLARYPADENHMDGSLFHE